jgi:hypothetical protein
MRILLDECVNEQLRHHFTKGTNANPVRTIIVVPQAMILIILSVISLSLVGALIARYPFAAAAHLP